VSDSQSIVESWVCLDAEEGEWNNASLLGHLAGFMEPQSKKRAYLRKPGSCGASLGQSGSNHGFLQAPADC
jgi:hypothetical protein